MEQDLSNDSFSVTSRLVYDITCRYCGEHTVAVHEQDITRWERAHRNKHFAMMEKQSGR